MSPTQAETVTTHSVNLSHTPVSHTRAVSPGLPLAPSYTSVDPVIVLRYSVINSHTDKPSLISQQAAPWHDTSQGCPSHRTTVSLSLTLPVVPTDTQFSSRLSQRDAQQQKVTPAGSRMHTGTQRNPHSPDDSHPRESWVLFPPCGVWTLNTGWQAWLNHFFFFFLSFGAILASPGSPFLS